MAATYLQELDNLLSIYKNILNVDLTSLNTCFSSAARSSNEDIHIQDDEANINEYLKAGC